MPEFPADIVWSDVPPRAPLKITVRPPGAMPDDVMWPDDKPTKPTAGDYAADVAKSGGIGLVKGTVGLAGLPGDMAEMGARGIDRATRFVGGLVGVDAPKREDRDPTFGSKDIRGAVEGATTEFYQPKYLPGEFAQTVGESIPAALAGPAGGVSRLGNVARFGVAPGLASETAGQATKGTPAEPWARAGAGVVTGGVAAGLTRPRSAEQQVRRSMSENVTPQMVDDAQRLVDDAAAHGIRLTLPEAIEAITPGSGMTDTLRLLESAGVTRGRMGQVFADRPQQIEQAARGQFDAIAPAPAAPSTIGPQVGQVANQAIGDVRQTINRAAQPYYDAAATQRLTAQEMAQVRRLPGYQEARDAVRADPQLNRYVANLPDDSIGFLNEVKKQLDQSARNAARPMGPNPNMQRAAGFGQDATTVRQTLTNASPEYAVALGVEAQARQQFLDPLMRGPLGKLAQRDQTTKQAIEKLFGTERAVAGSEDEIATAVRALAHRNPEASRQLVRAYVESTFNRASQNLQGGPNQWGGANFVKAIVGDPQDRANLREAIQALPNGDQIWTGFNRFLEIAEATGRRQHIGSRTAFNEQELKSMSQGKILSETGKVAAAPQRLLTRLGDAWDQWQGGRNMNQLANILTDPQGGRLLGNIASRPAGARESQILAGRLILIGDQPRRRQEQERK